MSDTQRYRQIARRAFATEFNDATHTFKESDDEYAPNFALLPSGQRMNRTFVVATVTETDDIGNDNEYWRARVVDPTGTFFVYAGQYQPEGMAFIRELEPPAFVSVTGKPSTYETDNGNTNVSLQPESMNLVDVHTKDTWVAETAERTMERIEQFESIDPSSDEMPPDIAMARDQYDDPTMRPYKNGVEEALRTITPDDEE